MRALSHYISLISLEEYFCHPPITGGKWVKGVIRLKVWSVHKLDGMPRPGMS